MHLTIVRHARAREKRSWSGDDLLRPLDAVGARQAHALAQLLARHEVRRIVCSPALRCQQSVQPLADMVELPVERWDELGPDGAGSTIAAACFANAAFDDAVLCTHGELMQPLTRLDDLRRLVPKRDLRQDRLLRKGSAWRLRITSEGRITRFEHLVPPRQ